jgi:hypothetical protein
LNNTVEPKQSFELNNLTEVRKLNPVVVQNIQKMHNDINVNPPKKTLKRGFYCKPRGTFLIESTQIRWFLEWSDRRLDLKGGSQRQSKLS